MNSRALNAALPPPPLETWVAILEGEGVGLGWRRLAGVWWGTISMHHSSYLVYSITNSRKPAMPRQDCRDAAASLRLAGHAHTQYTQHTSPTFAICSPPTPTHTRTPFTSPPTSTPTHNTPASPSTPTRTSIPPPPACPPPRASRGKSTTRTSPTTRLRRRRLRPSLPSKMPRAP